jgi:hypothetical protein
MDTNLGTLAGAVTGSEMQVDLVAITPDLALGTDISDVFGTTSLILATQADNVVNTSDGLQVTGFNYYFDGTTWDRVRGDSTDGLLVNLGTNNDVTVTGAETPADADATPTNAIPVQSFLSVYNGTTWDLVREGGTAGSFLVDGSGVTQPVSNAGLTELAAAINSSELDVNLASSNATVTVDLGANNDVTVTSPNAHDGTTLANPILTGARASNSIEGVTQVANADLTYVQADLNGVLLSRPHTTLEEIVTERDTITTGTSTAFGGAFAAPGANNHLYVTAIAVANTSATDTFIDFQDGASGTVIWTMALPANGGANMTFTTPLKVAANTALAYQVGTGVTTAYISVTGFTAQG